MCINKCVCENYTFTEILNMMKENNWTAQDVFEKTDIGNRCGMCIEYIEKIEKTGETEFKD